MLRNSLEEDDDMYFKRKFEERTDKCRLRCCVFGLTDIIYTGLGLIFCFTVLGFHLRQDLRHVRRMELRSDSNVTSSHNVTLTLADSVVMSPHDEPGESDNYPTITSLNGQHPPEQFMGVNWTSPYIFYGTQFVCLLIKLFGAILLFVGTQKRKRSSGSIEQIHFSVNTDSTSSQSNRRKSTNTRLARCSCKTWSILNVIVLPFLVFKLVHFVLLVLPFYYSRFWFIEAFMEITYRVIGFIFILDYLKFLRSDTKYIISLISEETAESNNNGDGGIPPSWASCLFCKSWCMLINECC